MDDRRFNERRREFGNAVDRLSEAVAQPQSDLIRDAVIQRFEITFELAWKTLRLWLEYQGHTITGPRQIIKKAFAEGLIATETETDAWFRMLDDRNLTSHAYQESLAKTIYRRIVEEHTPRLVSMRVELDNLIWQ